MKTLAMAILFASAPAVVAASPTVTISGPTVVAFFEPVTDADFRRDPNIADALDDFQFYVTPARAVLQKAGVNVHVLYATSFRLRTTKSTVTFKPKIGVGYYFVRPGKKPRVQYGVATDDHLLKVAAEYFGMPQVAPPDPE